jgi:hypothetical protein
MKISKIEKVKYKGKVYNLELNSSKKEDDLFWIEGKTGVITHNCFPKDLNAMLYLADQFKVPVPTLMGVHTTNQIVRQNRDWEQMEGRAVSNREESITLENQ